MASAKVNPFSAPERRKRKLRISVDGPAGSGKSVTGLLVLRGLVGNEGRIAVIDTEREAILNYLGIVATDTQPEGFDMLALTKFGVDDYCSAVEAAAAAGYDGLLIDSCSHEWVGTGGILESVDKNAGDNGYYDKKGWRKMTPEHNRFIDVVTGAALHVFATIRSKVAYDSVRNEQGKLQPVKIGLAPIQREGFDYEFGILGSMDLAHTLTVSKARTMQMDGTQLVNFLEGAVIQCPGIELGQQLRAWAESPPGEWVAPAFSRAFTIGDKQIISGGITRDTYVTVGTLCSKVDKKHGAGTYKAMLVRAGYSGVSVMTEAQGAAFAAVLETKLNEDVAAAVA